MHRRFARTVTLLVALALLPGLAAAEEIIYFTSGASMPIREHEIRGAMIHVDLGGDAFMAFPRSMVDRIEKAGQRVTLDPSRNTDANVMRPSVPDPSGSHPVRGVSHRGGSDVKMLEVKENTDPMVDTDQNGIAIYRPKKFSASAAKRKVGAYGHARARGTASGDVRGASRVGNRYVIGNTGPRRSEQDDRPVVVPLGRADATAPPPPAPSGESSGAGTTESSSGGSESTGGSDAGSH